MWRLSVLFGCIVTGAYADIFEFAEIPMPPNLTLTGHYVFQVYGTASQVNPSASVTFRNFEVMWSDGKVGINDYRSFQVSLIPWSKFWDVVDRKKFCSAERKLILKEAGIPVFTVGARKEATHPITATDKYLLTVTNCGERTGAIMTKGEVIVKQAHGYLPGNKIWTLHWLGWFTVINACQCIMWAIAVAFHCKGLLYIHKMIAACSMMAFLEAAMAYVQHRQWNMTGHRSIEFLAAMMFFYSIKYVLTLRMMIETASGSGIIAERLKVGNQLKLDMLCSIFLAAQWLWKTIISYKDPLIMDIPFLLAMTVPGTLLWLVIFIWVYRQFQKVLSTLKDKNLASDAVTLFINMRLLLVGSILLATVVLLIQLVDIVMSVTPWHLQWVPYDAAPHTVFTIFLSALMILWWPHADSWKLGYSAQVDQDENETRGHGKVHAEQIGIAEAEAC